MKNLTLVLINVLLILLNELIVMIEQNCISFQQRADKFNNTGARMIESFLSYDVASGSEKISMC